MDCTKTWKVEKEKSIKIQNVISKLSYELNKLIGQSKVK